MAAATEAKKARVREILTSCYIQIFFNLKNRLHTEIKLLTIPFRNEWSMRVTCFFTTFSPGIANFAFGE